MWIHLLCLWLGRPAGDVAEVLFQLLQEDEGENSLWTKTDEGGDQALKEAQWTRPQHVDTTSSQTLKQ